MALNDSKAYARKQALAALLADIDGAVAQLSPAGLILSATSRSFTQTQHQAEQESWRLIHAGIAHLHSGAPEEAGGSLASALAKASLRSSAIAAGLGIPAPQFEMMRHIQPEQSGHDEAIFFVRRLSEALAVDTTKSQDLILRALYAKATTAQGDALEKHLRSEHVRFFNKLAKCHAVNCKALREMADRLPPPQPPSNPTGGNFDL